MIPSQREDQNIEKEHEIQKPLAIDFTINPATEEQQWATNHTDLHNFVRYVCLIMYGWRSCKNLLNWLLMLVKSTMASSRVSLSPETQSVDACCYTSLLTSFYSEIFLEDT